MAISLMTSTHGTASRPAATRLMAQGPRPLGPHVLGPSPEPDSPGGDAEALACSIVCSRGDAGAQCFGLDLRGRLLAGGKLGAQPGGAKLGIAFWNYLGSRLAVPNSPKIPYLPTLVGHRCASV
jgi:hypothetical protein